MRTVLCTLFLLAACRAGPLVPSDASALTEDLRAVPGFVPLWWDAHAGRIYAELPDVRGDGGDGAEFLYTVSLVWGLGSNDVGLDRGQIGDRKVLRALRAGPRVLLVEPNGKWRSGSQDPSVARAARESFAESVVFGFDVAAEGDGRTLVDATDFFLRDAHNVVATLASTGQGTYALERAKSALLPDEIAGFPDNTEVDVLLTFTGDATGSEVKSTAPDARSVSLRVRHSFLRLPELGAYRPRAFHPRSGFTPHSWSDASTPVDEPTLRSFVTRHRLEKLHLERASSPPVEPIVYYVDRGAPEPVRTALLEGARYWVPVFEAAGFEGGFRVELLPEDADPHDARFNVIQWVNRSTRGWSYGDGVTDPRTGEILKGHVTLGALRVRQDVRIAEGLLSPYEGDGDDPRAVAMALARIRQLAAHEVGHTLGLAHNFAASTQNRASVMDYPAPHVRIGDGGDLDLSDAYREGCGEWDAAAIRYGYADFASTASSVDDASLAAAEAEGLRRVIADMDAAGLVFLTDDDARGSDRAHPLANLWDDGADPIAALEHEIAVRRIALARFSAAALKEGRPLAELEEVLLPLYLHHRYQLEAAVRSLGGVYYSYELRGESEPGVARVAPVAPVPAAAQRHALDLALSTLERDFIELPESVRVLVPPRPPGSPDHSERFQPGALLFDPIAAASGSAALTLELLLDPGRATRLVDQARRDAELPSFEQVLDRLFAHAFGPGATEFEGGQGPSMLVELELQVTRRLMLLASGEDVPARVREPANQALHRIAAASPAGSLLADLLARYFDDATALDEFEAPRIPPGPPIGCGIE